MRIDFDTLGDEQKLYEQAKAGEKAMFCLPVIARLDGRGFHNFTKGLRRPFDPELSMSMQGTATCLLEQSQADIVYTQSDEITLVWRNDLVNGKPTSVFFEGKFQKMVSILASIASVEFNRFIYEVLPEKYHLKPVFDCRVWQVPTLQKAAENLLWREMDATKNSITMAASAYYSHKELQGKHSGDKHEMLHQKGINWNDYPDFFKKGSYFAKRKVLKGLTDLELERIPEQYRPTGLVERSVTQELIIPKATSIMNLVDVYFNGVEPICRT